VKSADWPDARTIVIGSHEPPRHVGDFGLQLAWVFEEIAKCLQQLPLHHAHDLVDVLAISVCRTESLEGIADSGSGAPSLRNRLVSCSMVMACVHNGGSVD
jgi:hypothetical protein